MTRPEKVAQAQALRAEGLLLREIAGRMGVAVATASSYLSDPDGSKDRARKDSYRGTCVDCGKRTNGCNGRGPNASVRCAGCSEQWQRDSAKWTPETVVAAIQRFAERYGRPPGAVDWSPAMARQLGHHERAARFETDGDYPHVTSVRRVFGAWNAAVRAAGFEAFDHARDHDWGRGRPSKRLAA